MSISWKEGITTLAAAGSVVLERAYFHNWGWPLVSNARWVVIGMAAMFVIQYIFSYSLDTVRSDTWAVVAYMLGVAALLLAIFAVVVASSDFVVLMMLANLVFWTAAMISHLAESKPRHLRHHPAT